MPLVIENGSIVDGANSFIDTSYLTTFLADRGYSVITPSEPLLVRSFEFMAGLPWCEDHTVAFTVTENIKKAQAEIAYRLGQGFDFSDTQEGDRVKREKVDVLEQEFFDDGFGSSNPESALKKMPQAYAYLQDLLCGRSKFEYLLRA